VAVNSRSKGKRGELEAAKALTRVLGCTARRGQQFSGGGDSPDVVHSIDGMHVEVKRTERFNLYDALDQAKQDAADESVPVVMHRRNRCPWVVVVELDRLPELVAIINTRHQ
jgi:hypothetical protein